jgi:hypothetical protein
MSNTVASLPTEILIANLELEFELNHRKESLLKISNRKYFEVFSLVLPTLSASTVARPNSSNSNNRTIRNSTKPRNINTYVISNRNKIDLSAICRDACFSPRKGVSRDMIPALAPLK